MRGLRLWNPPRPGGRRGYSNRPAHVRDLVAGSVLYSTSDEDSHTEVAGLAIGSSSRVLSVTGSGCRSLALLSAGPSRVVSVDANAAQNHLLELKAAAMRELSREGFLEFIGFTPGLDPRRRDTYEGIRDWLSPEASSFWDESIGAIERGVLYSGAHERFYAAWIAPLVLALRGRQLSRLHTFDDVAEQSAYFNSAWSTSGWRRGVAALASPHLIRHLLDDPSYFQRVDTSTELAELIDSGLRRTFRNHLATDVDLFGLLCTGRYSDPENVPYYMRPGKYEAVRENLDALEVLTVPLHDHLESCPPASFDAFSLSDVSGWMSHPDLLRLMSLVRRTAAPGARIVFRDLFSDTDITRLEAESGLAHLPALSAELTEGDRALVFTVHALERPTTSTDPDVRA
ncbi:MAG: DUF3419 family protein [Micrococcus sp.]|nr:DUF3419 family protein [Micrococcus sp.]